jgi:hypothetical protein
MFLGIGQGVTSDPREGSRAAATASKQSGGRGIDRPLGVLISHAPSLSFTLDNRFYHELSLS